MVPMNCKASMAVSSHLQGCLGCLPDLIAHGCLSLLRVVHAREALVLMLEISQSSQLNTGSTDSPFQTQGL